MFMIKYQHIEIGATVNLGIGLLIKQVCQFSIDFPQQKCGRYLLRAASGFISVFWISIPIKMNGLLERSRIYFIASEEIMVQISQKN